MKTIKNLRHLMTYLDLPFTGNIDLDESKLDCWAYHAFNERIIIRLTGDGEPVVYSTDKYGEGKNRYPLQYPILSKKLEKTFKLAIANSDPA